MQKIKALIIVLRLFGWLKGFLEDCKNHTFQCFARNFSESSTMESMESMEPISIRLRQNNNNKITVDSEHYEATVTDSLILQYMRRSLHTKPHLCLSAFNRAASIVHHSGECVG